jgi:hypothetical protein
MKKVGAVMVGVLAYVVLLSQPVMAGTSFHVGISSPGMHIEASSVRPSPHHVWVAGHHSWRGHHRVWAPGHWRYAPRHRAVYAPVHHRHDRYCGHGYSRGDYRHRDNDRRGDHRYEDRRGKRDNRNDRGLGQGGYTDRNASRWD